MYYCCRLGKSLHSEKEDITLAKDANRKTDDWFEIFDPRNPLNKRRRGENTATGSGSSGPDWKLKKLKPTD